MTLDEFTALKKGDRVKNAMSESMGAVTGVSHFRLVSGIATVVSVQWDGTTLPMAVSHVSTVWMHWTKETEK